MLWENLKRYYLLAPVEGVIQLEVGSECVVPGDVVPAGRELETYNKGEWELVNLTAGKHYPLLHSSLDWPVPEQEPGYEYVLFVLESVVIDLHIEYDVGYKPISKLDLINYAVVRMKGVI
jgi:hypothetical protein